MFCFVGFLLFLLFAVVVGIVVFLLTWGEKESGEGGWEGEVSGGEGGDMSTTWCVRVCVCLLSWRVTRMPQKRVARRRGEGGVKAVKVKSTRAKDRSLPSFKNLTSSSGLEDSWWDAGDGAATEPPGVGAPVMDSRSAMASCCRSVIILGAADITAIV